MSLNSNTQSVGQQGTGEVLEALKQQVSHLESRLDSLQQLVAALGAALQKAGGRYVAVCPECSTDFDMLAHHYSIGLFDNLVYVKCPKCQKALPLRGGPGGNIQAITD